MKTIIEYQVKQKRIPLALESIQSYGAITDSLVAIQILRAILKDEAQEVFIALYLNTRNTVQGYSVIARGGQSDCQVDPRVLFRNAILTGAEAVIVAHNHPSGNPEPSQEDQALTNRLVSAGKLIGIRILDHFIIGDTITSMAARCML